MLIQRAIPHYDTLLIAVGIKHARNPKTGEPIGMITCFFLMSINKGKEF